MPDTSKIILEGSGGQGLGLGGKIMAEAAVASGLNASQSQSYGAQARGGFSSAQVIISSQEIVFPLVDQPNIIIALNLQSYYRNIDFHKTGGLLLYNTETKYPVLKGLTDTPPFITGELGFPFSMEAQNIGNPKGITLLAIGTLLGLRAIVNTDCLEEAVRDNFTPSIAETNLECFWQGLKLAREALKPCC